MSKTRKLLSVVLALVMVVSMLAVSVNAASYYYESDEDKANYTQTWGLSTPVKNADGTYSVDVSLTTNYATGPIQFVLTNTNSTVASIKSVTLGAAIPASYNADIHVGKSSGKVMINSDTSSGSAITATEINGVIATVVYTYSGSGSATIAIKNDAKSATNVAGTLIAARMSNANIVTGNPITGQTVTSVGNSVTIGAVAKPTLAVIQKFDDEGNDITLGVIDKTRTAKMWDDDNLTPVEGDTTYTGYIYGVEPEYGETVEDIFEVKNGGSLSYTYLDPESETEGTGTVVNVLDTDGVTVLETYVLVIFGDVNGDGAVDASDAFDIELHDNYGYEASSNGMRMEFAYQVFAGDINVDTSLDATDAFDIKLHDNYGYEAGTDGMRMYQADVMANL